MPKASFAQTVCGSKYRIITFSLFLMGMIIFTVIICVLVAPKNFKYSLDVANKEDVIIHPESFWHGDVEFNLNAPKGSSSNVKPTIRLYDAGEKWPPYSDEYSVFNFKCVSGAQGVKNCTERLVLTRYSMVTFVLSATGPFEWMAIRGKEAFNRWMATGKKPTSDILAQESNVRKTEASFTFVCSVSFTF